MTREIKFRAWDKIGEVMVYQDRITIAENGNWILISKQGSDFEGRGIPLMQYTGLHDKNGKEIYDGDILKADVCEDGDEEILPVEFRKGGFVFGYYNSALRYAENFEIIGNIYENPELIKK